MTYAVLFGLLTLSWLQHYLHDQERLRWEAERKHLLDRIQAPVAAQIAATEALTGPTDNVYISERERIKRKMEAQGLSLDHARIPDGWAGMGQ